MTDRIQRAYDREYDSIINDESAGLITPEQAEREIKHLEDDYRNAAEDAAEAARERELEEWGMR